MHSNRQGGYVGLLMLIISTLIIAFLFWRSDLFSSVSSENVENQGLYPSTTSTPVERGINAVQQAQKAKQQLENQYNQETQFFLK